MTLNILTAMAAVLLACSLLFGCGDILDKNHAPGWSMIRDSAWAPPGFVDHIHDTQDPVAP
jgi:hypothetical protein